MRRLPLLRMQFLGGLTGKLLHLFEVEDTYPDPFGWATYGAFKRVHHADRDRPEIPSVWD